MDQLKNFFLCVVVSEVCLARISSLVADMPACLREVNRCAVHKTQICLDVNNLFC